MKQKRSLQFDSCWAGQERLPTLHHPNYAGTYKWRLIVRTRAHTHTHTHTHYFFKINLNYTTHFTPSSPISPHACYMHRSSHHSWLDCADNMWRRKITNVLFIKFRIVFSDVLPCKIIADNYFTRQYIPELNFILAAVRTWNLTGLNVAHLLSYFKELKRYFLQGLKEQEKDLTVALVRDLKRILSKYESDVWYVWAISPGCFRCCQDVETPWRLTLRRCRPLGHWTVSNTRCSYATWRLGNRFFVWT
jgi:hypothetical protein